MPPHKDDVILPLVSVQLCHKPAWNFLASRASNSHPSFYRTCCCWCRLLLCVHPNIGQQKYMWPSWWRHSDSLFCLVRKKKGFSFFYDFLFPLLLHNTFLFNLLICIFSWLLYSLMARSVVSFEYNRIIFCRCKLGSVYTPFHFPLVLTEKDGSTSTRLSIVTQSQ